MPKTIDITKGISAFDDRTDFSRNNQDRQQFGKHSAADALHIGSEYDVVPEAQVTQPSTPQPTESAPPPPKPKFTHKLANGETLEAESVEALAAAIEKSLSQQPTQTVVEFEDKPLYQPVEFKRKELSLTEQANILNVWKENPQKAMRMLQEAEFGTTIEAVISHLNQAELREFHRRQDEAAADFLAECETYNPTPANGKKLTEHLKSKNKPITKNNLTVAFNQLVAAGDKALLRPAEAAPVVEDPDVVDTPPPPTVVPSGSGPAVQEVKQDADAFKREFATWSLAKQQQWFADQQRKLQ